MARMAWLAGVAGAIAAGSVWAAPTTQEGDVVVGSHPATHTIEFKIVSASGVVAFTTPDDWGVLAMGSRPPVASVAFQVADPADQGTPDSTNVGVNIYHLDTDKGRAAAASMVGKAYGAPPTTGAYNGWTTYSSQPQQGDTTYVMLDAGRTFDDQHLEVGVRCAWPHLATHKPDFDDHMIAACHALMDSVTESLGPYSPQANEIVRRPNSGG